MKVYTVPSALLCLLPLVLSYPLLKGTANDTGNNLFSDPDPGFYAPGLPNRCNDQGFDAVTLDDKGVMHFFGDNTVWFGYQGPTQRLSETWPGLSGRIDAAFRSHSVNKPQERQRVYMLKGSQVWSYCDGKLVPGYPRLISEEFPGVPNNLDAAVECHQGDCKKYSVLFFKDDTVYVYSPEAEPKVKQQHWPSLGRCTAAGRWTGRYYCFNGVYFNIFNPVTGQVLSPQPLDARNHFVRCPGRGHGHAAMQNPDLVSIINRCSNRSFDALSSDDLSRIYATRGGWVYELLNKDGYHAWPLRTFWKNLQGPVDAAFAYESWMYFIQGSQVIVYTSDEMFNPVAGYPKAIQEEWEVPGLTAVDAAFTCPHSSDLYLIRGNQLTLVNLKTRKRCGEDRTIIYPALDAAMCNNDGVYLFIGSLFYHYKDVPELLSSEVAPTPGSIASYFLDC